MPIFWKLASLAAPSTLHDYGETPRDHRPRSSPLELASLESAGGSLWEPVDSSHCTLNSEDSAQFTFHSLEAMVYAQGRFSEMSYKFPRSKLSHLKVM